MNTLEQQLRNAADEVSGQYRDYRFTAGVLPGWLVGILLTVIEQGGPAIVQALTTWLQSQAPTPIPKA